MALVIRSCISTLKSGVAWMPIFISYNHSDSEFAETLAMNLVQAKHNIWIDKWELSAGDSLIDRIEEAIEGADALLVLLSKNSINSTWCRKELKSGLLRELEERSVIVIPILIDDCKVPLFLREKLYVDLRHGDDKQFKLLLDSLDKISNPAQSRTTGPNTHIDWAMCSVDNGDNHGVEWTFIEHGERIAFSIFCQVLFWPNKSWQHHFNRLPDDQARFVFASECMKNVLENETDLNVLITSAKPEIIKRGLRDLKSKKGVDLVIRAQRLGDDNGFDTLVQIDNYFKMAIHHTLSATRQN
jgi:hypothetical protein